MIESATPESALKAATFASALFREVRFLAATLALGGIIGGGLTVLTRDWVAVSRFMPESAASSGSRFAAVAAQFGFSVGTAVEGESIDFYAELARSRDVLSAVAFDTLRFREDEEAQNVTVGTFVDLMGLQGDTQRETANEAVAMLTEEVVRIEVNPAANMVTLEVRATSVGLAEALNRRLLEVINEFNVRHRRSRAAAERDFLEERLREAEGDLRSAEYELRDFLERNRMTSSSPRLVNEQTQLERRVTLSQELYVGIAQAFEQARIEVVRATPLLTVVDQPEGSAAVSRGLVGGAVLGGIVATLLALSIVLLGEYVSITSPEPLPRSTSGRVRAIWRKMRRGV